jgi:hypothetical protein
MTQQRINSIYYANNANIKKADYMMRVLLFMS